MLDHFFTLHLNFQSALILLAVFLVVVHVLQMVTSRKLPPGPCGAPLVGVFPRLGKKPYLTIQNWWVKYGDIFSMYMGTRLVVVINGLDAMKECFVKQADNFNGRPWNYFKKLTKDTGIVFTDGEVWREHRRFTISCMRDFGMGKISLQEKIHEEMQVLMTEIAKENGKPFDIRNHLPKAVANIICSIIYGSRFDYSDEIFKANIDALDQSVRKQSLLGLINFIPFLEFLPKLLPKDKLLMYNVQMRNAYAKEQLQRHKETFDPDNPRDFIDAYWARMADRQKNGLPTTFADRHLERSIQDLFIAGTETVNTTLKWSLLFMVVNQDVQTRVQKEIDKVIGPGRLPSMKDRPQMPYTEATIMECQRLGNIALFSVPREAQRDTTLAGHHIPKGAWIFINRWGMHSTIKYWKNPKRFNPDRFLGTNGEVVHPEAFVPFGVGPRNCMGEQLAKMDLFLFFTTLLQVFRFKIPEGSPTPSLEPVPGINMSPRPYLLCATPR